MTPMTFDISDLIAISLGYLAILFLVAYISESGRISVRFLRHPIIYVLSLGVYVSAWGMYGIVGFADRSGYNFLAFYLGVSGAFLLTPVLLVPILKLTKRYQLGSLADLFAYRYRSQSAGSLTTLAMLLGMMPLLALQIRAVSETARILAPQIQPHDFALVFCAAIVGFTLLFGARHITPREKHEGLVVAIALESIIKLCALISVAYYGWHEILGGYSGLKTWLAQNPEQLNALYQPMNNGFWHVLILSFLFSALVMPYMYQMIFTENSNPRSLLAASWGFPLFLFFMALCIPIILWAGLKLNPLVPIEFYSLGIALSSQGSFLPLFMFLGGLAAASGILVVSILSLTSMTLNHLVLPIYQPKPNNNIYHWVLIVRRALIIGVAFMAYGLYLLLDNHHNMTEMAMLTFVATLQFAPGIIGVLFWPGANRNGFIAGLCLGMILWAVTLLVPYLMEQSFLPNIGNLEIRFRNNSDYWLTMGLFAIVSNATMAILVSLFTKQSTQEAIAASTCSVDNLRRPYRWELIAKSVQDFINGLSEPLGKSTAEREVLTALSELQMNQSESRPYALRRLRDQIESNLSGLLGPSVAQDMLEQHLPYNIKTEKNDTSSEDIHYIESRIEDYKHRLSGLAGELDALRRFHRQTLFDLPIGVCSLGRDQEILSWNHAMITLTGISDQVVIGSRLSSLPKPWSQLFAEFLHNGGATVYRQPIETRGETRWISLNRAIISDGDQLGHPDSQVIVVEDTTDLHKLEQRLAHNERLASIGRLAAGVAHEIGNPITGIACLAQDLKAESSDDFIQQASKDILEQTQRVSKIMNSLVGFARADSMRQAKTTVDIKECLNEAIHLLQLNPSGRDFIFSNECDDDVFVVGDRQRLTQVFINLLSNAIDASPNHNEIIIRAHNHGLRVHIEIEDFGMGLPAGKIRDVLFEPFVTTKEIGKGTGLGLALVHGIISEHDGKIQLTDKSDYDQGRGVIVQIVLPAFQHDYSTDESESNAL